MKKCLLLFLLIFFGCSKDEDSSKKLIDLIDGNVYNTNRNQENRLFIIDKSNKYFPVTRALESNGTYECMRNLYMTKDAEGRFLRTENILSNETRYEVHTYVRLHSDGTKEARGILILSSSNGPDVINLQYYEEIDGVQEDYLVQNIYLNNNYKSDNFCSSFIQD